MKKQKVMSQMEGQYKTTGKQLNEVEIGNVPEKEFRIMLVKLIQDLRKEWRERLRCKKYLQKTYKNKQMNNTLEGINSRITEAEERDKWPGGLNAGNHCCRRE